MADQEKKGIVKELKEFIFRGNVMDMAVGVVIGAAFSAIITSLVSDIFMPLKKMSKDTPIITSGSTIGKKLTD